MSIVVLQAKQAGSVLRSIYKSFTIASTRSQHGQHNSRFLDCPWESTFFCKYSTQPIICLCPVFVKLANRPLFLHQREGMTKTSQELRMLSSVTINCQVRMIVWIQVLNCKNCNQCLKCQVSSTVFQIVKNEGEKWGSKIRIKNKGQKWGSKRSVKKEVKK